MLFHTQILNNTQYYNLARNTFCAKNLTFYQKSGRPLLHIGRVWNYITRGENNPLHIRTKIWYPGLFLAKLHNMVLVWKKKKKKLGHFIWIIWILLFYNFNIIISRVNFHKCVLLQKVFLLKYLPSSFLYGSQYSYKIALHPLQVSWTSELFWPDFMAKVNTWKHSWRNVFQFPFFS